KNKVISPIAVPISPHKKITTTKYKNFILVIQYNTFFDFLSTEIFISSERKKLQVRWGNFTSNTRCIIFIYS
ncbi:MAG TPA: hypothetical protein PLW95_08080, partial [bacterium]|nr:hypothetical protein [bacterium]